MFKIFFIIYIIFHNIFLLYLIFKLLSYSRKINELKKDKIILTASINKYKLVIYSKDKEIGRLTYALQYKNDDIKKAIKIAMIHSHPDKGGNAKDFILFKSLYKNFK